MRRNRIKIAAAAAAAVVAAVTSTAVVRRTQRARGQYKSERSSLRSHNETVEHWRSTGADRNGPYPETKNTSPENHGSKVDGTSALLSLVV